MPVHLSKTSIAYMVVTALIAWLALALQQYIIISNISVNGLTLLQAIGRFLLFFTVLTNILVALSLSFTIIAPGSFLAKPVIQTGIAVAIVIVAITYNTVLRGLIELSGWPRVADELLHVVVPILYVLYWLLIVRKGSLKWSYAFWPWLIYPGLYLVYALWRGHTEGLYPYPFIDLDKLDSKQVALNSFFVVVGFILVGLIFIGLDKWMGKRR